MTLVVRLLGPVQISRDDQPISVRGYKPVALLAYLLVTGKAQSRQHLVDLLFDSPADPKASLRWTLSELRKAIGGDYILADRQQIAFDFNRDYWLDVTAFEAGQSDLYRGDFLEGLNIRDSFGFEEWSLYERERLKVAYQVVLTRRLEASESSGDYQSVIETAHQLLRLDNLREEWYCSLMQAYARQGQREAALDQFDLCRQVLKTELGAEPAVETVALAKEIRQGIIKTTQDISLAAFPPRSLASQYNLPPQPTPFIGREAELTALENLIADPNVRLVTIVGLGGMGKTRLSLALAEILKQSEQQLISKETNRAFPGVDVTLLFPNGIFFVPLAPLSAMDQIVPTIAQALNFRLETGGQTRTPQQQLLDYLHQKRLLIIMDSYEHLLTCTSKGEENEATELLAEILHTAPGVQILVTSQERLHLREEHIYAIQGLEFPDWETPEDTAEYASAKLFMQSARRVRSNFELVADDLPYLTRICRLVEGMPLGIELAVSWVDMLSLTDIATEMQHSLDFLETEVRNIPERHRSMRAVFDTSLQRLDQADRDVFSQLSVFRGGFTRNAFQEVTGASLRALATLANKSLLRFSQSQDRYEIHELLWQYGLDKLAEDPTKEEDSRDRHSAYYCAALQQREIELRTDRQQAALAEIEADIQNALAAWDWAIDKRQYKRLEQAINGLGHFYEWRGRYQEGEETCQQAAEGLAGIESGDEQRILAKVLAWQGVFNATLERSESASRLLRRSLDLLDSPDLSKQDTRLERAFISIEMGRIADAAGDRQEAKRLLGQSLALYRELDDQWGIANVLQELSNVAWNLGAYNEAQQLAEECLALRQGLGDRKGIAKSLDRLGLIAIFEGKLEESKRFLQESISIHLELGDLAGLASATGNLGSAFKLSGDFVQARDLYEQTVAIFSDLVVRHFTVAEYRAQVGHASMHLGIYKEAIHLVQTGLKEAIDIGDQRQRVIALALVFLGEILLAEEEYSQAQQKLQKGVTIYRAIGQQAELAWALSDLSLAEDGLGNTSEAEQHAYEALQIAAVSPTAVFAFGHTITILAYLLANDGKKEQAVELYALASRYSYVAKSQWFEDVIGRHITAAIASLPPEVAEAAQARGQALDLWQTIAKLLERLSERGWGE